MLALVIEYSFGMAGKHSRVKASGCRNTQLIYCCKLWLAEFVPLLSFGTKSCLILDSKVYSSIIWGDKH